MQLDPKSLVNMQAKAINISFINLVNMQASKAIIYIYIFLPSKLNFQPTN